MHEGIRQNGYLFQDRESPEVLSRLGSIDRRYQELIELSKLRKQRLEDAAALYQLFNEADGTEQWIAEKVIECFFNVIGKNNLRKRMWCNRKLTQVQHLMF